MGVGKHAPINTNLDRGNNNNGGGSAGAEYGMRTFGLDLCLGKKLQFHYDGCASDNFKAVPLFDQKRMTIFFEFWMDHLCLTRPIQSLHDNM
jgi:hypothetical protein